MNKKKDGKGEDPSAARSVADMLRTEKESKLVVEEEGLADIVRGMDARSAEAKRSGLLGPEPWYAAYYVTVMLLATIALAATIFDPDPVVGKFWLGVTVVVGWFLIVRFAVRDALGFNRKTQQEDEGRRSKEG